jgi:SAM-dependent methyltransferase
MKNTLLYSMDDFPVSQNRVYATAKEAMECPRGDIRLLREPLTGIIYNSSFEPDRMMYDEQYQNEQGHSLIFQEHLDQVATIIGRNSRGKSILEIGCGKGTFLELMRSRGFAITGLDPAYEGSSDYILKKPFSPALGLSGDAIILRHVLEHIPDPLTFLLSILEANGGKGLVYIETPCLDWICHHRAWFDIYYEHVNYFRLSDFSRIFGHIIESGRLFGGQYLYVVADLASICGNPLEDTHDFRLPDDFLADVDRAIARMKTDGARKNIVWGAASKGVIFTLLILRRGGIKPDLVIDINPAKQGKYMPLTGLQISSPREALAQVADRDSIFVMNSNYFEEIKSLAGDNVTYYRVDQNEL